MLPHADSLRVSLRYMLARPLPQAGLGRWRRVSVFLSDVETDTWSEDWLGLVVALAERVVITRGSQGATEYNDTGVHSIDIVPVRGWEGESRLQENNIESLVRKDW